MIFASGTTSTLENEVRVSSAQSFFFFFSNCFSTKRRVSQLNLQKGRRGTSFPATLHRFFNGADRVKRHTLPAFIRDRRVPCPSSTERRHHALVAAPCVRRTVCLRNASKQTSGHCEMNGPKDVSMLSSSICWCVHALYFWDLDATRTPFKFKMSTPRSSADSSLHQATCLARDQPAVFRTRHVFFHFTRKPTGDVSFTPQAIFPESCPRSPKSAAEWTCLLHSTGDLTRLVPTITRALVECLILWWLSFGVFGAHRKFEFCCCCLSGVKDKHEELQGSSSFACVQRIFFFYSGRGLTPLLLRSWRGEVLA